MTNIGYSKLSSYDSEEYSSYYGWNNDKSYFLFTGRWENLVIFGKFDAEEYISILFHEGISFDGDNVLEFYLGSFCFLWLKVVRVDFLNDDFRPSPCVYLHFEPFILVHFYKRISCDVKFFKGSEVPCTDEIMLILDEVVGEIEFNKSWEIASNKFLSVDTSDTVSGDW